MKPTFHVLGELERQIMDVVWRYGKLTVREVTDSLKRKRSIAYTTVMTVMNRLTEKKILSRKERGGAFVYAAVQDRERFMTSASDHVIKSLISQCGEAAIAQFIETLDQVDPKKLALLEKKLKERRG